MRYYRTGSNGVPVFIWSAELQGPARRSLRGAQANNEAYRRAIKSRGTKGGEMPTMILKYPLEGERQTQVIAVPRRARFLSVIEQHEHPTLYFAADIDDEALVSKTVYIIGTGRPLPPGLSLSSFVGTVSVSGGSLIWHVFLEGYGT